MTETHFYMVRGGYALHIPDVVRESAKLWAKAGWGVDLSNPELRKFAEGQMHKLVKLDTLSKCSTIAPEPQILKNRIEEQRRAAANKPAPTKVEADVKASGIDLDTLPGIKAKPKRKASPKPSVKDAEETD